MDFTLGPRCSCPQSLGDSPPPQILCELLRYLIYSNLTIVSFSLFLLVDPVIKMDDPKENRVYTEGDRLKANCTIGRIYPEIKETDFIMKWGGSSKEAAVRKNDDESYRCLVDIQKKLSMEDHGKEVICNVTTNIGPEPTVLEVRRTLNVECE